MFGLIKFEQRYKNPNPITFSTLLKGGIWIKTKCVGRIIYVTMEPNFTFLTINTHLPNKNYA